MTRRSRGLLLSVRGDDPPAPPTHGGRPPPIPPRRGGAQKAGTSHAVVGVRAWWLLLAGDAESAPPWLWLRLEPGYGSGWSLVAAWLEQCSARGSSSPVAGDRAG